MSDDTLSVVRRSDDREIPAAGHYEIDPAHSSVEFIGRHLMISKVRGRFDTFRGHIEIGDDPEQSSVEVVIDAASISTGNEERDTHLRSADFFDVDQYPHIAYRATSAKPRPGNTWEVMGELTIRDATVPVALQVDFDGGGASPFGDERVAFSANATVNREDFGLSWNVALETGGWLVGTNIRIELSVEAIATGRDSTA